MSLLRRPELPLFVLVFGVYAYFYQAGGWNQNSRFDLTRAIVEQGTVAIDAFHENTGDKAQRAGRWYSDKAPGLSWLAVPPYAIVHALNPGAIAPGAYVSTVFALALPSALASLLLFRFAMRLGLPKAASAAVAVAYALGTLALPYSTILYGHQLQAALAFSAFVLVGPGRAALLAGALLGFAVAVDYTSAIAVVVVGLYGLARFGARAAAWMAAGAVPPLLALGAYHASAFGHPLALPYDFVLQEHRRMGWFMGIGAPDPSIVRELLVGEFRGLFFSAPWLAAAIPGLVLLARHGRRAEAAACGAMFAAHLLMNAGLVDWHGGWTMGPRYLIPAIPFLAAGVLGVMQVWPRRWVVAAGTPAVVLSILLMLVGTAVRPEVPLTEPRPFRGYLFPLLQRGRVARSNHAIDSAGSTGGREAWNLGHRLGLQGLATLVPLGLWIAASGIWLSYAAAGTKGAGREDFGRAG